MDLQVKAGVGKELLAFSRTKKLWVLVCVFIGLSVLSPLMIAGLGSLVDSMSDTYEQLGMDVSAMTEELSSSAMLGVSSQISDLSFAGLLVFLLLINSFAGGEQKKRSIIIPQSSGLSSIAYILPKFIVYPSAIFVLSLAGVFTGSFVASLVFDNNDIVFSQLFAAAVILGVCNMFYVCLHLALGTGTGKACMSSAVCIVASVLLPNIFSVWDPAPVYNPFTMNLTAVSALYGRESASDLFITVLIALIIMAAAYFIALFAQNAKKIDNSGDEIVI